MKMQQWRIQSLNVRNKTFIITTGKIDQNDAYCYLMKQVKERMFAKGSVFKIYAGAHGYRDGRLGDRESDCRQLGMDINSHIWDGVEDAIDDKLFEQQKIGELHDQLRNTSGARIMESIKSKDLVQHMRKAISLVREEMPEIIDEMQYNLNNPEEIGKDRKDEDLRTNHEAIFDDLFNSMTERNRPYVIFLAFCFSDRNQLTYYMGELGIIAACSMKHDRGEITRGRWFKLDEGQEYILRRVRSWNTYTGGRENQHESDALPMTNKVSSHLLFGKDGGFDICKTKTRQLVPENFINNARFQKMYSNWRRTDRHQTKNLLLAGSSGTGKTILLAEAMHMRIAYYVRKKEPICIIIAVWKWGAKSLVEDLTNKYFPSLADSDDKLKEDRIAVEVYDGQKSLCTRFGVPIKDNVNTKVADINALLRAISKCSDKKVLLFLDELYFEVRDGKMDCRNLIAELENVDFFIAINPWCGKFKYDFVPPESPRILARQLRGCHRNSEQIQYLIRQFTYMTGLNRNVGSILSR